MIIFKHPVHPVMDRKTTQLNHKKGRKKRLNMLSGTEHVTVPDNIFNNTD